MDHDGSSQSTQNPTIETLHWLTCRRHPSEGLVRSACMSTRTQGKANIIAENMKEAHYSIITNYFRNRLVMRTTCVNIKSIIPILCAYECFLLVALSMHTYLISKACIPCLLTQLSYTLYSILWKDIPQYFPAYASYNSIRGSHLSTTWNYTHINMAEKPLNKVQALETNDASLRTPPC
jgi:hypothetical protein